MIAKVDFATSGYQRLQFHLMASSSISAICSFCSREDKSIKVVCKKYCLICRRCQLLPATRQLILDYHRSDPNETQNALTGVEDTRENTYHGDCPLCGSPMTKNIYYVIKGSGEDDRGEAEGYNELDLGYKTNPFIEFLAAFRSNYGNIGFEIRPDYDYSNDGQVPKVLSADSGEATKFPFVSNANWKGKAESKQLETMLGEYDPNGEQLGPSKESKTDMYSAAPPVLSHAEGLAIISEALVYVWQSLIRGSMYLLNLYVLSHVICR